MNSEKTVINGVEIIIDSEVKHWSPSARYPYYRLRGKRISKERAFEIIRRYDVFFSPEIGEPNYFPDHITCLNFYIDWFEKKYGWVHPNGIVGLNDHLYKNQFRDEILYDAATIAKNFPYLDLIVVVTEWDSYCPERWKTQCMFDRLFYKHKISRGEWERRLKELRFTDFERVDLCRAPEKSCAIEAGILIRNGTVELMNSDRAYEKYIEYEKLYEEPDPRIYIPGYYKELK